MTSHAYRQHVSKGKQKYVTPHGVHWHKPSRMYAVMASCSGKNFYPKQMGVSKFSYFPTIRAAVIARNRLFKKLGYTPDDRRYRS